MGSGTSSVDANVNTSIFRKDQPLILACDRHHALILPVRLTGQGDGSVVKAGTVVARNSTSTFYDKYDDNASSGLNTACGILLHDCQPATGGTEAARVAFRGEFYESNLTGLDAAGKVDLKSRSIIDATGTTVLTF